jgi:hypothetical protein
MSKTQFDQLDKETKWVIRQAVKQVFGKMSRQMRRDVYELQWLYDRMQYAIEIYLELWFTLEKRSHPGVKIEREIMASNLTRFGKKIARLIKKYSAEDAAKVIATAIFRGIFVMREDDIAVPIIQRKIEREKEKAKAMKSKTDKGG